MASRRSRVRRLPARAAYDQETIQAILDEGLVAHVGFVDDGQPFVIPMAYARMGDELILHGSAASRLVRRLAAGVPACVTVTLLDGLVLARSLFHHSMNYRAVVALGTARPILDPAAKQRALAAFADRLLPGRSAEARAPTPQELRATTVLSFPLDEATAKLRTGPPQDPAADLDLPTWAGVLPLRMAAEAPVPAPDLASPTSPPTSLRRYQRDHESPPG